LDHEPQVEAAQQVETELQVEATEQAEAVDQEGEDEFSIDDFDLPEFNEEDALAEADVEVIPEPVAPTVDSQLDAEPPLDHEPQ
ncbi:hypothetical protein AB4171_26095, partial [Vibrio sp. 10N.286.51.A4]